MKKLFPIFFFLLFISTGGNLLAQITVNKPGTTTTVVTGKVIDANGLPLSGATVVLKFTTITVLTDVNGNFSINVPKMSGAKLTVSFVGYELKTVDVTAAASISLKEDNSNLSEVVVTGLATSTKRANSANSISTISAKQLTGSTRPATLDAAMQGKIPGAQITANSGAPGGGFSVRLRGVSSINLTSEPLYIIDGVYVNNSQNGTGAGTGPFSGATGQTAGTQDQAPNRLADINPADIENIEILKGPSAAAIYGTRANAGVIIITTKRAKAGKTQISVGQDFGAINALKLIGMQNVGWDATKINQGIWLVPNSDMLGLFNANGGTAAKYNDYEKIIYGNTGLVSNTRLNISGGTEKARFLASASRWDETGIQKRTGYQRNSLRLNADFKPTSWWDIGIATNYLNTTSNRSFSGNDNNGVSVGYNLAYLPGWLDQMPVNGVYPINPLTGQNILEIVDKGVNNEKVSRIIASFSNTFYLLRKEHHNLKLSIQGGLDYVSQENVVFMSPEIQYQQQRPNPGASRFTNTRQQNTNLQAFLTYNASYKKINFTTSAGAVRLDNYSRTLWFQGEGLPIGTNNPGASSVQVSSLNNGNSGDQGLVAQQEINWDDKVIASGGFRFDKSSLNGFQDKYYAFPRASLAINLTNFDFWKIKAISQFKLRSAFGRTGNPPAYGSLFTAVSSAAIGGATGVTTPTVLGNTGIVPETSQEIEVGADIGLLNNRIGLDITYYNKSVLNFINTYVLSPGTGVSSLSAFNVGDLKNTGVELGIRATIIQNKNLKWNSNISWFYNRTIVTRLIVPEANVAATGFGAFGVQRLRLNSSPTAWYGTPNVGGFPTQYEDAQPKWQLSWGNSVTFKNFEFSMLLHRSHKNFNSSLNQEITDEGGTSPDWSVKNDAGVPLGVARQLGQPGITTRQFIQDASFTKLREVSIYYNIPKNIFNKTFAKGIESVRVGVSGQNLALWTNYFGYDPEGANFGNRPTIAPVDLLSFPSARRLYFHLNINF